MARRFLTAEEAEAMLPEGECVHTFYNLPDMLVGADWRREDVVAKLHEPGVLIELTGEKARSTGHGICVHPDADQYFQSDILFIETDEGKIKEWEDDHAE